MDHRHLRGGDALGQALLGIFVHQEADGAAVHAVDRLAGIHELVQGLQHQPVAAERHDHVGGVGLDIAVALLQPLIGLARLGRGGGDEGDVLEPLWRRLMERDPTMERAVLVYTTWPSIVEAERAGRSIVEKRLAACVNILPGMISHYWWEGKIERAEEVVMIVKTRASLAEAVREAVKELHSYTTPAIMVLPLESVDADYYRWIVAETEGGATQ